MAADIGLSDGLLSIEGTEFDDVAEVYSDSGDLFVKLTSYDSQGESVSERNETFAAGDVQQLYFNGGDGDDLLVNDSPIGGIARAGAGDDMLLGGQGDDVLIGGIGNDTLSGGGGNDLVLDGPGDDTVIGLIGGQESAAGDAAEDDAAEDDAAEDDAAEDDAAEDDGDVTGDATDQTDAEAECEDPVA